MPDLPIGAWVFVGLICGLIVVGTLAVVVEADREENPPDSDDRSWMRRYLGYAVATPLLLLVAFFLLWLQAGVPGLF